jgi:putative sporulation protein YyaC
MAKSFAEKLTVHLTESCARKKLSQHLLYLLGRQEGMNMRPLVMLCIGSDRYAGDALGPLIGSYLKEQTECAIYGNLDHPVHAGNLVESIHLIHYEHHHPIIVAIDACLGKSSEIGNIETWEGGLRAGIAVGNQLPCAGDISIIGVVNSGGQFGYLDLQNTPLSIVIKLSKMISGALIDVIGDFNLKQKGCMLLC